MDKTKIVMANGSLMKVKSIKNAPILQYFWPALSDNWFWKPIYAFLRVAALDRFYYTERCPCHYFDVQLAL